MELHGMTSVKFGLENCETIYVPYQCFESLNASINDDGLIEDFECHIIDNGLSDYDVTYEGNTTCPIVRLSHNDITSITFIYDDRTEYHEVMWGDDNWGQSNERQSSTLLSYKEVCVLIEDLPDSSYMKDIFAFLETYEDYVTVQQIRDSLMSLDEATRRRVNDCPSLICALRQ